MGTHGAVNTASGPMVGLGSNPGVTIFGAAAGGGAKVGREWGSNRRLPGCQPAELPLGGYLDGLPAVWGRICH